MAKSSPEDRTPLHAIRIERGLSRERLAAQAEVSARTIYAIEHGRTPTRPVQFVLAAALAMRREEVFPDA